MTTMTTLPTRVSPTVDRFLEAVRDGVAPTATLFAEDVVLDATVPDWRFTARGREAVISQYGKWFNVSAVLEELERFPVDGGEVVIYLQALEDNGVPSAAHHCHVLRFDADGRIARDSFFCGGRWGAARLAEMAAAERAG